MSTPVPSKEKVDDLSLYAPRRSREHPATPAPDQQVADAPTLATALDRVESKVVDLREADRAPPPTFWPAGEEAPPVAPETDRQPLPASEPSAKRTRMPQGLGGPNLDWSPRPRARHSSPPGVGGDGRLRDPLIPEFEGDAAVRAMRQRLSLDPDIVPSPPVRRRSKSIMPFLGRLSMVVSVAAVVAYAITVFSLSGGRPAPLKPDRSTQQAADLARSAARLVIERRQTFANEALALGVALSGANGGEFALLTGLAEGTRISSGGPFGATGWRLPARDLGKAFAYAPKDFVGVMDAAIDVRAPNDALVDRQLVRLEWLAKQHEAAVRADRLGHDDKARPAVTTSSLDADEVAMLLKRGMDYFKNGDLASARLVLRRAALAGNQQAALTLGSTYDPQTLADLGVLGFAPDLAQARAWYQRAAELGSAEAARRAERLAQAAN